VQIVGYVALGVVALGVLLSLGLIGRSVPDISRYRRIRKM
jgi:hypothetical protein